jgi:hypothetical protein
MKPDNPIGIFIFFIIDGVVGVSLFIRHRIIITPAIVFVDISFSGCYLHVGCVTLHNHHFLLWFPDLSMNLHRFLSIRVGINFVPFLGETEEGYSYH